MDPLRALERHCRHPAQPARITTPITVVSQDRIDRLAGMQRQEGTDDHRVRLQILAGGGAHLRVLAARWARPCDTCSHKPNTAIGGHRCHMPAPSGHHRQGRRQRQPRRTRDAHTRHREGTSPGAASNGPGFATPAVDHDFRAAHMPRIKALGTTRSTLTQSSDLTAGPATPTGSSSRNCHRAPAGPTGRRPRSSCRSGPLLRRAAGGHEPRPAWATLDPNRTPVISQEVKASGGLPVQAGRQASSNGNPGLSPRAPSAQLGVGSEARSTRRHGGHIASNHRP